MHLIHEILEWKNAVAWGRVRRGADLRLRRIFLGKMSCVRSTISPSGRMPYPGGRYDVVRICDCAASFTEDDMHSVQDISE